MYAVFNKRTGHTVRRCRDQREAHRVAQDHETAHEWSDNDKFDYKLLDEATAQEYKRRDMNRRKRQGKVQRQWA